MATDSSNKDNRTVIEYNQSQASRQDTWDAKSEVRETVGKCARALARGEHKHYHYIAVKTADILLPELLGDASIENYDAELFDHSDWYFEAVSSFVDSPQQCCELLDADQPGVAADARTTIEGAFRSCVAIAEHRGIIQDEFWDRANAMGFARKVGEHLQKYEDDYDDEVDAVTFRLGALKHFFTGGTGGGKSVGASGQMQDYHLSSVFDGRDYKCLDPVGLSSENIAAYDLPQEDSDLRSALQDHGLPPSWDEAEAFLEEEYGSVDAAPENLQRLVDYEPVAEYFVPLTPGLSDFDLPYDTEAEAFVPQPFVVPAADCPEDLYAAVLGGRVSEKEMEVIREAYREVNRKADDWSVGDLKRSIRRRSELAEGDREQALRVLTTLQDLGFIGTRQHEHALDDEAWRELFHSTDRITAFNQLPVESEMGQLFIIAYLLDQIWTRRIRSHGHPSLVTWLRELWEIAPHREHRRKEDDVVQNIMEFIISRLTKMQRKPRDINQHIIADTQDYTDPERAVRTRFNRYIVFGGSDSVLRDIFSAAGVNGWKGFKRTLTGEPGHAGIIGACDFALGEPRRYGLSPVHLTPPLWHHYDKNRITSGWKRRTQILEHEELRNAAAEWDAESAITSATESERVEIGETANSEPAVADDPPGEIPEPEPVERLSAKQQARLSAKLLRSHTRLSYEDIAENIRKNPQTGAHYDRTTVRNWAKDIDKGAGGFEPDDDITLDDLLPEGVDVDLEPSGY